MTRINAVVLAIVIMLAGWAGGARALTLTCDGILGNSGAQGAALVRFGSPGAAGLGVVCDRFGTLWDRAGAGTLNRYAVDGRLLGQYRLPPGGADWNRQDQLALAGDLLVLKLGSNLYSLPIIAMPGSEVTALNIPAERISFATLNGWVAVYNQGTLAMVNPATKEVKQICAAPTGAQWLELTPDGALYAVGGDWQVHKFANGQEVTDGWPKGNLGERFQFLDGSWYAHGWHGTIKRYSAAMEPQPGVVLGGASGSFIGHLDQNSELVKGCGLAKVRDNLYAVSGLGGIMHLLAWQPERGQMELIRRIGAATACRGLGLDRDGNVWYHAGSWQWNDAPDTPLRFGVNSPDEPVGQAVMLENDYMVAPGWLWGRPCFYRGRLTGEVAGDRIEGKCALPRDSAGTAVYAEGDRLVLLVIDKAGQGQSFFISREGQYQGDRGPVALKTAQPVAAYTALAMAGPGTLLAAGDGAVIEFARNGNDWVEQTRWNSVAGDGGGAFGKAIYLCVDDGRLWVSDREQHRVLVLDLKSHALLGQFGQTGTAGASLTLLDAPEVLTARNGRAVVYDSGNQRLVKIRVR